MPTHDEAIQFFNEYKRLSAQQKALFRRAQAQMVSDLKAGHPFSVNLRIHRVKKVKDVWEMTWDANGRATFNYGTPQQPGDVHIHWRRVGDHSILNQP